mmetsp:Transcript_3572/g.3348  ORF Transcript_3572/g.3348 Transcript_3572/m.3348 type:complete len:207 (-) Transcript_3572:13-633(-)
MQIQKEEEYKNPKQVPIQIQRESFGKKSDKVIIGAGEALLPPKEEKGLPDVWGDIEDEDKSKVQKLEHKNPKQEPIQISIEYPTKKPDKSIIGIGETLLPPKEEKDLPDILNIVSGNKEISQLKADDLPDILPSEPATKGNPYEFLIQNKKDQEKVQYIQSSQIAVKKERNKPKQNLQYNPRKFMLPQDSGKLYEEHKIPFNEEIY